MHHRFARRFLTVCALILTPLAVTAGAFVHPDVAAAAAPGLVAAYSFDAGSGSSLADDSGNGNVGSIAGAVWSASGKFGSALSFDGAADMVSVADAPELDLSGALTLEAWVRPTAAGSMWRTVVLKEQPGDLVYGLYGHATTAPEGIVFTGGAERHATGTTALALNTWTHLAVTYDGAMLRLYANGTQTASFATAGAVTTSSGALRIGGNAVWNEWFAGLIDEVRLYNRALGAAEIQADMSTPVTPPAASAAPVASYSFDAGSGSSLVDESGNGNTGSISGALWSGSGKYGGALSFDGIDDVVTVADAPELDLTTALTVEAWVRPSALGFWETVVLKERPGNLSYGLFADGDSSQPAANLTVGGAAAQQIVRGSAAVPLNAWTHLATTYDGASLRLFVNGALAGSVAQTGAVTVSDGVLRIGGNAVYANEYFKGLIDEVRIYGRALTATEIQADMSDPVGTPAPPPPPPAPAPAPAGTVASYSFDAGSGATAADDSGNGNAGVLAGGVAWTTAGRFGGALSFDGVDDWVTVADAPELDLSSGMTLEAWLKPSVVNFWKAVLVKEQTGDLVYGLFSGSDTSVPTGQVFVAGQQIVRGTAALPLDAWSHLATTYDGATQRLYVNGVLVASRPQTGTMPASAGVLRIGGTSLWPNEWFRGLIDEVRVYGRALSASEIQTDMSTAVGGGAPGDATPPTTPSNLTATGATQSSIALAWSASIDNTGVASYTTYRDGVATGSTGTTGYTFAGLACGTTYTLGVDAVDAAGNRSGRASIGAATAACSDPAPPPPPPPSGSASVYVSPSGSDGNPCTATARCLTFDRAYRVALPGQVVEVAAGSYPSQSINTDAAKTSASDVLFRPAAGATVSTGQLTVRGQHVEFRDFRVNGDVMMYGTTADVTLRNLDIRGGFFVQSSQDISILGGSVGPGVDYHPMIVSEWLNTTPPRNILVDGVNFHDWTRSGPDVHTECLQIGGGDGVTIRNSRFTNCSVMDLHITWYGDAPMTRNVTVENNFFSAAGDGGSFAIQANAYANLLIRNNSLAQALIIFTGGGQQGPNTNVRVIGNVGPRGGSWACESGVTFRYNVWDGATCGPTDVNAPSGFVNPGAGDFHLRAGAAAINRGDPTFYPGTDIDGQARPLGGAPDAGADEAA